MSPWPRYAAGALLALSLALGGAATAQPNTPAARADQLNEEGKKLFGSRDYAGAAQKFRQAIVFSNEGRFWFNLCWTLNQMGQYREALTACESVGGAGASNPLIEKTNKVIVQLRTKLQQTGDPGTGGGGTGDTGGGTGDTGGGSGTGDTGGDTGGGTGDTGGGTGDTGYADGGTGDTGGTGYANGGTGNGPPPPPPPDAGIVQPPGISNDYKWSWGVGLGAVSSSVGAEGAYADSGGQLKADVNFLVSPARALGLQGYVQFTGIGSADYSDRLEIIDLGGALFQHRQINNNLMWTWMGGAHFAIMRPESLVDGSSLVTAGLRGEVSAAWLFGSKHQHALHAGLQVNIYLPASESGDLDPAQFGLDKAGATAGLTIGYAMRFSTPFGQTPIITLE